MVLSEPPVNVLLTGECKKGAAPMGSCMRMWFVGDSFLIAVATVSLPNTSVNYIPEAKSITSLSKSGGVKPWQTIKSKIPPGQDLGSMHILHGDTCLISRRHSKQTRRVAGPVAEVF
jgi:hypothetical protein